jgi:nicotinamide-nucleotide amidase
MICEILSVGTELLMGQIANTDAQYLSRRLSELGVAVYRHMTVGDNPARVLGALDAALSRSDLVITTGGLGPTEDDLTKEMVARHFGLDMVLHQPSLDALAERMRKIHPGRPLTDNNIKQAYFPRGSFVMPNRRGTAPGCIVEAGAKAVAVLPGPPRELRDMFEQQLEPYLLKRREMALSSKYLRIFGVGESAVEDMLIDLFHSPNPTLALYCGAGEVQARITASGPPGEDLEPLIAPVEAEIRKRLGDAIYAEGRDTSMHHTVLGLLLDRGETIALAESCTGGKLAALLTDCPGASGALMEGYVTYSNQAKMRLLGVDEAILRDQGAVSAACAEAMAQGARRASGATWALSVTGIAGPDGGSAEKPVGTVFIGLAGPDGSRAQRFQFLGDRGWIRTLSCQNALNLLRLELVKRR